MKTHYDNLVIRHRRWQVFNRLGDVSGWGVLWGITVAQLLWIAAEMIYQGVL